MQKIWAAVRRPFVLNLRALALLRMGTAGAVLLDLAIRSTDLEAHYSNLGCCPACRCPTAPERPTRFRCTPAVGGGSRAAWQVSFTSGPASAVAVSFFVSSSSSAGSKQRV